MRKKSLEKSRRRLVSVAKQLPEIEPFFMQSCPLCGRANRMVVKGVCRYGDKTELYPDIGYHFCNCKCIFYTPFENIKEHDDRSFQNMERPLEKLTELYGSMESGQNLLIRMPDPFFCDWGQDPYEFLHWNPRRNHILFDKDQFCEEAKSIGFEIVKAERDFNVGTETPQTMEILLRKP